jgi:hypothetical protein
MVEDTVEDTLRGLVEMAVAVAEAVETPSTTQD